MGECAQKEDQMVKNIPGSKSKTEATKRRLEYSDYEKLNDHLDRMRFRTATVGVRCWGDPDAGYADE